MKDDIKQIIYNNKDSTGFSDGLDIVNYEQLELDLLKYIKNLLQSHDAEVKKKIKHEYRENLVQFFEKKDQYHNGYRDGLLKSLQILDEVLGGGM